MKTIVHIGMPKAGSTALQTCFKASAAELARHGVLYPENPGDEGVNHLALVAQFVPPRSLPREMRGRSRYAAANIGSAVGGFFSHLHRQIETSRPRALVLSYEGLFRPLPRERHALLRESYRALGGQPRFVAYLRRPSEHYLSSLQQRIKASSKVTGPAPRDYRRTLESYDACFGPEAVTALLYDRRHLERGDIVADFCARFLAEYGVDPARLRRGRSNATLSAESMELLWRYRAAFHADRDDVATRDSKALLKALANADARLGASRPRLKPGVAEAIDYGSGDALWLRDRFGVVFPDLDYDRLAAETRAASPAPGPGDAAALDQLIVIDRAMQARLADEIARSSWAADEGRRAWLESLGAARPSRLGALRRRAAAALAARLRRIATRAPAGPPSRPS
jgi:hypothetical protein